jgi:pyruvate formate lyase activating enzyme
MQSGIVFDIMHFSTRDGPGIRTTVFLKGCPLHCAWCHNPESQSILPQIMLRPNLCIGCGACLQACEHQAITRVNGHLAYDRARCHLCGRCVSACTSGGREMVGRQMWTSDVLDEVEKDRTFFDESGGGVTFSGGEALLQRDFLQELVHLSHDRGLHTVLDTSGFAPWEQLEALLPEVDLFLYDIKAMDDEIHRRYTGVSNSLILENLGRLSQAGAKFQIRMPFIPGVNDSRHQMEALGRLAASLPGLLGIELLAYHKIGIEKYKRLQIPYLLEALEPPSEDQLQIAADVLLKYDVAVSFGG